MRTSTDADVMLATLLKAAEEHTRLSLETNTAQNKAQKVRNAVPCIAWA
jgi:hypothetical protein